MLRQQYVTVLVEYDDTEYEQPAFWGWSDLLDTPCIVHSASPSEPYQERE